VTDIFSEIRNLLLQRGGSAYHGEAVTQLEHALQAGWLAQQEKASTELIVAALLHDIGHLLEETIIANCAERGRPVSASQTHTPERDLSHETLGADWLEQKGLPLDVTEPIRMHVPAKRYLCRAEPGYLAALSPTSVASLRVQGGPMTEEEAQRFQALRHFQAAVRLRRWDEAAKVPDCQVPALDSYRELVLHCLSRD
jgi:phosphonate degradation associated HDIG domain protein